LLRFLGLWISLFFGTTDHDNPNEPEIPGIPCAITPLVLLQREWPQVPHLGYW